MKKMIFYKKAVQTVLFCVVIFGSVQSSKAQFNGYVLNDPSGKAIALNDALGEKLTVLDFWATWCKPCLNAIPELIEISKEYEDKGVKFVGINEDSPRNLSKVKPLAEALGITYQILHDADQQLMNTMNVSVFPTIIIVDSKGKSRWMYEGFAHGSGDELRKKLDKLLKSPK